MQYLPLQPEAALMKTVLSHANLIDCIEPRVRPDNAVLIEDGRIRAILPSGEADKAGDAQIIDLKGGYLMPGLWDVHIHPDYLSLDEMPLADQVTLFGHRLAAALTESGIVGLRCAGAHHFMDVAWKRAFDSGQHVGPRLFASGYFLTTTGGHFLTSGHAFEIDGPYGCNRPQCDSNRAQAERCRSQAGPHRAGLEDVIDYGE